jgi:hypothetical protein
MATEDLKTPEEIIKEVAEKGSPESVQAMKSVYESLDIYYEEFVYREYADYLIQAEPEKAKGLAALVLAEKDFLKCQQNTWAFPMAVMLMEMNEQNRRRLKVIGTDARLKLAQCYSIAIKTNEYALFIQNLGLILEQQPGNLTKWADAIIKGYRKHLDEGLP